MLVANDLWVAVAGFLLTTVLTALWRLLARHPALQAIPNARSFHATAKPTGGGVAIAVPLLLLLLWQAHSGVSELAAVLAGATGGVAILGLVDDLWDLSARGRLLVQAALVLWLVLALRGLADPLPGWPAWVALPVLLLGLLWFLNLYNFMDGIDGLAASQAAAYSLAALWLVPGDIGWPLALLWLLLATTLAFLAWNWAPSKLFMGDVGSAFLGLLTGALALLLAARDALPLVASLILFSAFWFDASYTLCVRILTGQRFTEGHRSHLYQKLAARFGHGRTTAGYLLLFAAWLWPLAAWAPAATVPAVLWCMLACAPLAAGCWRLRAGLPGADTVNVPRR